MLSFLITFSKRFMTDIQHIQLLLVELHDLYEGHLQILFDYFVLHGSISPKSFILGTHRTAPFSMYELMPQSQTQHIPYRAPAKKIWHLADARGIQFKKIAKVFYLSRIEEQMSDE